MENIFGGGEKTQKSLGIVGGALLGRFSGRIAGGLTSGIIGASLGSIFGIDPALGATIGFSTVDDCCVKIGGWIGLVYGAIKGYKLVDNWWHK